MFYFLFWFILLTGVVADEWIDPHDMNSRNSRMNRPVVDSNKECNCSNFKEIDLTLIYLKRIVGLLVTSTITEDEKISSLKGKFSFDNMEDYEFLIKFSSMEEVDQNHLRQLNSIMHSAFRRKISDEFLNHFCRSNQTLSKLFENRIVIFTGMVISLYLLYSLLKSNFSFAYIWKYFLFIIWIIDYGLRYQALTEVSLLRILV